MADNYDDLLDYGAGYNLAQDKASKLIDVKSEKELRLRKDTQDYGNDGLITRGAKSLLNMILPEKYALTINKDGKRYSGKNKIFNDNDLGSMYNSLQANPRGDKTIYYLKTKDGYNDDGSDRWLYKVGISDVSASYRYKNQLKDSDWQLIDEKRVHGAEALENMIHGNNMALKAREYDYNVKADDFGSGKTELYNRDILGLDVKTEEEYAKNKAQSRAMIQQYLPQYSEQAKEDTLEFIDAFKSSGIKFGGRILKVLGTAYEQLSWEERGGDGAIEALGKKLIKDSDMLAGYNPKTKNKAISAIQNRYAKFKLGGFNPLSDTIGAISDILTASPQVLAESAPDLLAYSLSSVATGNPLTGIAVVGTLRSNDILDVREQNNNGKKATAKEVASVWGASMLMSAIEYGALHTIVSGSNLFAVVGTQQLNLGRTLATNPTLMKEFLKASAGALSQSTKGAMYEGVEEMLATTVEFIGERYNTNKYDGDSIPDLLSTGEYEEQLVNAGALGMGAGKLMGTPTAITQGVRNFRQGARDVTIDNTAEIAGNQFTTTNEIDTNRITIQNDIDNLEVSINSIEEDLQKLNTTVVADKIETVDELKVFIQESDTLNRTEVGQSILQAEDINPEDIPRFTTQLKSELKALGEMQIEQKLQLNRTLEYSEKSREEVAQREESINTAVDKGITQEVKNIEQNIVEDTNQDIVNKEIETLQTKEFTSDSLKEFVANSTNLKESTVGKMILATSSLTDKDIDSVNSLLQKKFKDTYKQVKLNNPKLSDKNVKEANLLLQKTMAELGKKKDTIEDTLELLNLDINAENIIPIIKESKVLRTSNIGKSILTLQSKGKLTDSDIDIETINKLKLTLKEIQASRITKEQLLELADNKYKGTKTSKTVKAFLTAHPKINNQSAFKRLKSLMENEPKETIKEEIKTFKNSIKGISTSDKLKINLVGKIRQKNAVKKVLRSSLGKMTEEALSSMTLKDAQDVVKSLRDNSNYKELNDTDITTLVSDALRNKNIAKINNKFNINQLVHQTPQAIEEVMANIPQLIKDEKLVETLQSVDIDDLKILVTSFDNTKTFKNLNAKDRKVFKEVRSNRLKDVTDPKTVRAWTKQTIQSKSVSKPMIDFIRKRVETGKYFNVKDTQVILKRLDEIEVKSKAQHEQEVKVKEQQQKETVQKVKDKSIKSVLENEKLTETEKDLYTKIITGMDEKSMLTLYGTAELDPAAQLYFKEQGIKGKDKDDIEFTICK